MRVDVEYRPYFGSIWLKRGHVIYGVNWYGRGPVRKRAILKARMQQAVRPARVVVVGVMTDDE